MEASPSKDDATKQLIIITHMNTDHQDSLVRYLEYFCHLSSFSARNAHLTSITFSSMTIASSPTAHFTIPISPPLTSWSEARPRVVAMDAEATAALHRSGITVKKYKRPKGWMTVVAVATTCTFIAFSTRSNFQPGSLLYDSLLHKVPTFAAFCSRIQPFLLGGMVVIHGSETAHMARTRLKKHSVPLFSKLWWKWVVSTFFEGFGNFVRFDGIVKDEEEKKMKAKH